MDVVNQYLPHTSSILSLGFGLLTAFIIVSFLFFILLGDITYVLLTLTENIYNLLRKLKNKNHQSTAFSLFNLYNILIIVNKEFPLKIIGSLIIATVSLAANNMFVFICSVFIIATLVAPIRFLEMLFAILFKSKDYFDLEKANLENQKTSPPEINNEENTKLQRGYLFEIIYRLIVNDQLTVIKMLKEANKDKMTLENFYQTTKWTGNYLFDVFMEFLIKYKLVAINDNIYSLGEIGKDFLSYLKEMNIPDFKDR